MTEETQSLRPSDPAMRQMVWLENGGNIIGGDWDPDHSYWKIDGRIYGTEHAWQLGYRFARATPASDRGDGQAPAWTIEKPGVLVHRNGMHRVSLSRIDTKFYASWRQGPEKFDYFIGGFTAPERAKAAAEQHAAWCVEFGIAGADAAGKVGEKK
jgi:hypothetical protein